LGAKLHDAKDPGADLSAMLHQVVGSVFLLMQEYEPVWRARQGSQPADLFGFRFDVGLDPVAVNLERMLAALARGAQDLAAVWSLALGGETIETLRRLARDAVRDPAAFHLPDELWARIIFDFAGAHRSRPLERAHLLKSLTPLYLGRVASWVIEAEKLIAAEVEERIERLCLCFEEQKPYLLARYAGQPGARPVLSKTAPEARPREEKMEVSP
jgi:hypothetical protein